jgi:hypothetical protein
MNHTTAQLTLDMPGTEENIITPHNFTDKFLSLAATVRYQDDPIEAARVILRRADRENRAAILAGFKTKGCTTAETTHRYLMSLVNLPRGEVNLDTFMNRFIARAAEERYSHDPLEAARDILRGTDRKNREAILASLKEQGCTDPQSTRRYLAKALQDKQAHPEQAGNMKQDRKEKEEEPAETQDNLTGGQPDADEDRAAGREQQQTDEETFRPYGAWTDFTQRLSRSERAQMNREAEAILAQDAFTDEDKAILRRYSGFGGIDADNERGVLYDYYTAPPLARMAWKLLGKLTPDGFTGKKILEPSCGTGVFFETAPAGTLLTGVELDPRSARIARILHPGADIVNASFEQFNLSRSGVSSGGESNTDGAFDMVVGNVPFGERTVQTSFLDMPEETSLDRYFISRSLDRLHAGGLMALIAAPGVLSNKTNEDWRRALSRKARFLGAVKLNDSSFRHTHTSVQPDILFFRKYPSDIIRILSRMTPDQFRDTDLVDQTFIDGSYFTAHPQHIMGNVSRGTGQWGADTITGEITPASIMALLDSFTPRAEAHDHTIFEELRSTQISGEAEASEPEAEARLSLSEEEQQQAAAQELHAGQVKVQDGTVYILNEAHYWQAARDTTGGRTAQKMEAILALSHTIRTIREAWRHDREGSARRAQEEALSLLHGYHEAHGSYPHTDKDIISFVNTYPAVRGIFESFVAPDAEILTSQDNLYRRPIQTFDGHNPAIAALTSLRQEMLRATDDAVLKFFPHTADTLFVEMQRNPDIFLTPSGVWELREDFVTGNAWEKIDSLKRAAAHERSRARKEKLEYGAAELEQAVGWIPLEEADFSPHSSWIPEPVINAWVADEDGLNRRNLLSYGRLSRNEEDKWGIRVTKTAEVFNYEKRKTEIHTQGEWEELNDEIVYYLNMQKQRSKYNDTKTFDEEHTEQFKNYIINHPQFRDELERQYNRLFHTEIAVPVKTYPVHLAGWNTEETSGGKTLRPHQWQTIHHLYRQGKGISALGTGFGKTLAGIGLMTLLRQENKLHRVWLQVPNNKVKDWEAEIKAVMPSRQTAAIDPEEKGYSNRSYRYAAYHAIANSSADIIIMPESAASEIQLSPDTDKLISDHIAHNYRTEKNGASKRSAAQAEERGRKQAGNGKTNRVISFEDFGCDALVVDEAHRYKNLFSSNLSRETGLNDGRQSAKAMSLFKKTEYIRNAHDGHNVFLLTATPLTNSPLEYFNMISFIAPEELKKFNIHTIDGFIKNFADIEMSTSYDWKTGTLNTAKTLVGFKNIQALQSLFFKYTDYQNNPVSINLEKPASFNNPNIIAQDKIQSEALKEISDGLARYQALAPEERQAEFPGQNFLTFYSNMRTASLDLELYDPAAFKNWKNPKLQTLSKNVFDSYSRTNGGQVVFCDRVFSGDASFNLHDKIKKSIVEAGFKSSDIIIINGFTKSGGAQSESVMEKETAKAVEEFNEGKYKVIIGTTACIGEGLNLQKNSAALHHFDIPYRPSDFIQRNGRIDRQGNSQDRVTLHTYMAAGTIDNYSVNLVQKKADWIDRLLKTKSNVFTNPDADSYVDPDEIMLALTEEWGDADKAQERRAELERVKAHKEQEAWREKCRGDLASLALMRGSLINYSGDKGKLPYQNRIRKIAALEKQLRSNPAFTDTALIESNEPFLYNKREHLIIRTGDMLFHGGFQYTVRSLDFKKQEAVAEPLIKNRYTYGYAHEYVEHERRIAVQDIKNDDAYFPQPPPSLRALLNTLHTLDFYQHDDMALKAACYRLHVQACRYNDLTVPVFCTDEQGTLNIENSRFVYREPLNPFVPEEQRQILDALNKGLVINDEEAYMPLLKTCLPRLHEEVRRKLELMNLPFENTADNLKKNVMYFSRFPVFPKPLDALNHVVNLSTPEQKQEIIQKLRSYGCVDAASTKKLLSSWVQPARTASPDACAQRSLA